MIDVFDGEVELLLVMLGLAAKFRATVGDLTTVAQVTRFTLRFAAEHECGAALFGVGWGMGAICPGRL